MEADPHLGRIHVPAAPGVHLYWIPLGAGGSPLVRWNGRVYEGFKARRERRQPQDLYHTALEVVVEGKGRFTIENGWPSPDADLASRGVLLEGPVFSRRLARLRIFRYEVRCWPDGVIPDAHDAVGGPQLVSGDQAAARGILEAVGSVPLLIWGRDELGAGEMWNSNSVISWLLTRTGLPADGLEAPAGGRAPGWNTGIAVARQGRLP